MRLTRRGWLAVTAGLVAGCGQSTTTTTPETPPAPRAVTLTTVSVRGLDQALSEMRGKVVLVDAWFLG